MSNNVIVLAILASTLYNGIGLGAVFYMYLANAVVTCEIKHVTKA